MIGSATPRLVGWICYGQFRRLRFDRGGTMRSFCWWLFDVIVHSCVLVLRMNVAIAFSLPNSPGYHSSWLWRLSVLIFGPNFLWTPSFLGNSWTAEGEHNVSHIAGVGLPCTEPSASPLSIRVVFRLFVTDLRKRCPHQPLDLL